MRHLLPLLLPALHAAAPDDAFTVVALPDTQYYACGCNGGSPDTFLAQTAWVVDAQAERKVAFVTQLGDCVENGDNVAAEWDVADAAFATLEDPATTGRGEGIPYGVAVGNHDQTPFGDAAGSTALYNATFGVERFQSRSWYGGHYGADNDNHYALFTAEGTDFLVLHLEYDPAVDPGPLDWAAGVLTEHGDRLAIVVSHHLIDTGGTWGTQGQAIYEALRDQPNLILMLSGHVLGTGQRSDTWGERTVHTLLADYQGLPNGGNGWLRLLTFSRSAGTLTVETWSPTLGVFDTSPENAFVLPVDLGPPLGGGTDSGSTDSGTGDSGTADTQAPTDSAPDSGSTGDSAPPTHTTPGDSAPPTGLDAERGCGCSVPLANAGGPWLVVLFGLFGLGRRR